MINVTQYGAKGDGATDDTAAIQRAIDAVPTAGGTVFFPPGTYIVAPSTIKYIGIKSNVHLIGASATTAVLKIKPHIGNWARLLGPQHIGTPVTNISVDTLGFDANIDNNPESVLNSDVESTFQTFVHVQSGSDLHIRNCNFVAAGVWVAAFNGSIDNCSMENNTVKWAPRAANPDYDNSCFYIDGTNYKILNNTFTTTIGRSRSCIETHGGPAECAHNHATGFQTLVNVVGQWEVAANTVADISIHDNSAVDSMLPIRLESVSPVNLIKIQVRNNTLGIAQIKHLPNDTSGIEVLFDSTALGSVSDLQITGNKITFQDEGTGRDEPVYNTVGIGVHNLGGADNVVIDHNTIILAPAAAIRVGLPEPGQRDFSNVQITNNTIVNPGQNVGMDPYFRDGILVSSTASNMIVSGNTITENFPVPRMINTIAVASGYTNNGMRVTNNSFNGGPVSVTYI